jgi:hypothetical protein
MGEREGGDVLKGVEIEEARLVTHSFNYCQSRVDTVAWRPTAQTARTLSGQRASMRGLN